MLYDRFSPSDSLKKFVKEYWVYENHDPTKSMQKVIPDGYSEIIIHYGDPYRINLAGSWQTQTSFLFSNQISKYFFLENTGVSAILGIKLHPTSFHEIFQIDMQDLTDQVLPLDSLIEANDLMSIKQSNTIERKIELVENWLKARLTNTSPQDKIRSCLDKIFNSHGMIEVEDLASGVQLSTRQLERQFKKVVGLPPKFYSRIIRFNYIFEVIKDQNDSWIRTALQSGYFDQSHFIKNFKEFTGEEPSSYGFDEVNLANFFLKR